MTHFASLQTLRAMSAPEDEYQQAKANYIAAQARLRRAKANRPAWAIGGVAKSDLAREAGFRRDDAVMARYRAGVTRVATLAHEFSISQSCVRSILCNYVGIFADSHSGWRKDVEDRIAIGRRQPAPASNGAA